MNKIFELSEAVAQFVQSGDHIAFGGFTTNRKPIAAVHEIIRQGLGDFTLTGGPAGSDADLLIGAGRVKAYINCFTGNSGHTNVPHRYRAAVEKGAILYEDYSQDAVALMLHAAALGLPYLPVRLMLGTDMVNKWGIGAETRRRMEKLPNEKLIVGENPFRPGEQTVLLPVPELDTAVIHVHRAAADGTCAIEGSEFHDVDIATAARRCIVTCEELVTAEELSHNPSVPSIPGCVVDAVVHLPYGAHPSQCYGRYDYDSPYYMMYDKASQTQEDFDRYLDEWIYATQSHAGYLDKLGATRLLGLKVVPGLGFHISDEELKGAVRHG